MLGILVDFTLMMPDAYIAFYTPNSRVSDLVTAIEDAGLTVDLQIPDAFLANNPGEDYTWHLLLS